MIYRSSQIKLAKTCITKSYYRYHLGLVRKGNGGKSIDLSFGTLVHKAVELFLTEGYESALLFLEETPFKGEGAKTIRMARVLLNVFRMKFKDEFVCAEKPFEVDIGNDITLKGRFDLITRNSSGMYVGEIKTSNPYFLLTKPNDQFIEYFIAARELFTDVNNVFLYNLDPNMADLKLSLITYTRSEIDDWLREIKAFLTFYQQCVDNKTLVKNNDGCTSYGYHCEYLPLCQSTAVSREAMIAEMFAVDEEQRDMAW